MFEIVHVKPSEARCVAYVIYQKNASQEAIVAVFFSQVSLISSR